MEHKILLPANTFTIKIIDILFLPFFYVLSLLPLWVLYRVSDAFYLILYYIIGYRKTVVRTNLHNSFPDKSPSELKKIEKQYYAYLCDLLLETFKTLTIGRKSMLRHCSMEPAAVHLFEHLYKEHKGAVLVLGHQGNWEWAGNTVGLLCRQPLSIIYHPISNPFSERLMIRMRTRFGNKLIPMKQTFRKMLSMKGESMLTAFVADQAPSPEHAYWTKFLHQDTPIFEGVEKMAKKLSLPVVYVRILKKKRGYYSVGAEMLESAPENVGHGEITLRHAKALETSIMQQPETWLWSHRRWKHAITPMTIVH